MKNETISGIALQMTEHAIGSIAGGIIVYQIGVRYAKASGFSLVALTLLGAFVGSIAQSAFVLDSKPSPNTL